MNELALNFLNIRISQKRTPEKVRYLTADEILSTRVESVETDSRLPLEKLEVQNLLSFGDQTQFNFGRLNILVGPNGSGKSNLIDCLRILRYAPFAIQDSFSDMGFDDWLYKGRTIESSQATLSAVVNVPDVSTPISHELVLSRYSQSRAQLEEKISQAGVEDGAQISYFTGSYRSHAELTALGNGKRRKVRTLGKADYNPLESILSQFRDVGQYPEISHLAKFYGSFRIYSEWTFGRNSNLREATSINRTTSALSENLDDLALTLATLARTSAYDAIRELLGELKQSYVDYSTHITHGLIGLELIESPFIESPIPAKRLSDGTLRFLALAAILLQSSPPPLICLEEPELGMHPDMIRTLAGMIVDASTKTQLVITTHSEHLLTALQDEFDCLFAFDSGPNGSVVSRLTREEYLEWRANHNLGKLWSSGELGGVRY